MSKAFAGWAESLTPAEADAIERYQSLGTGYDRINKLLRTGKVPQGYAEAPIRETIAALDSAIAKGRMPFDVTVSRAIRGSAELLEDWQNAVDSGLPWTENGFMSTSMAEATAPEFHGKAKMPAILSFVVPAGAPAVYPPAATGKSANQLEILLGRGHKFLVRSIKADGKITRIQMELTRVR